MAERDTEAWWTWHWDFYEAKNVELTFTSVKRWRRGSFLTVYRIENESNVEWWVYLPFNLAFGFAYEKHA